MVLTLFHNVNSYSETSFFHFKRHRVELYLFNHCHHAVAACWGEVFFESYAVEDGEVGGKDVVGRQSVERSDYQGCDPFCDDGVAVGGIEHGSVAEVGVEPDARLASFDEILRLFVFFVNEGEGLP